MAVHPLPAGLRARAGGELLWLWRALHGSLRRPCHRSTGKDAAGHVSEGREVELLKMMAHANHTVQCACTANPSINTRS